MENNLSINIRDNSRDELLTQCLDLRLAVSPTEKKETLENYLKAVYDETEIFSSSSSSSTDFDLENDPVYIGKNNFSLTRILGKILTFF